MKEYLFRLIVVMIPVFIMLFLLNAIENKVTGRAKYRTWYEELER